MQLRLFAADSRPIAEHDINSRTTSRGSVVCCLHSQSRAVAERDNHQRLFYPSVSVWGKFNSTAGIAVIVFPYSCSERIKRHHLLPMKVQGMGVEDLSKGGHLKITWHSTS
ncbi:hypothetical protein TNCV_1891761 [Trichonephila clavipes]|nr:hypothetical protein TNCV_1891761 [Trichonephila clavipes]